MESPTNSPLSITNKWECLMSGGEWLNPGQSFDNIYKAIGTLFIMATASSWSDYMYLCASVTDVDYVQVPMNQTFWIYYYIFFTIVGAFFLMNLFVGVVISMFNSEQDKLVGNNLLTDKQREWLETRLLVLRSSPIKKIKPPQNCIRMVFYRIQTWRVYQGICFVCIILNTVILAMKWYRQPLWMDQTLEITNYYFTAFFAFEAFVQIMAYGYAAYFQDNWNQFDFVVVVSSVLSIVVTLATKVNLRGAVTIVRAFRVLRVIRLIKRAKSLNMIFNTFLISLPGLVNIGALLLLLLYLYSILGMQLFGNIKWNGVMNDTLNFETFTNAFCALCAVATGDGWNDIMGSTLKQRSIVYQCMYNPTYQDFVDNGFQTVGCGIGFGGIVFFFSFYLLINLIFLNLFIAIILQGFQDTMVRDQRIFNQDLLIRFREVWSDYDPMATTFLPLASLRPFLIDLGEPLGFSTADNENEPEQDKFIASLKLPTYNGMTLYQFCDVLDALSLRSMVLDDLKKLRQEEHTQKKKEDRENPMISPNPDSDDDDSCESHDEGGSAAFEDRIKSEIEKVKHELILKKEGTSEIKALKELESAE